MSDKSQNLLLYCSVVPSDLAKEPFDESIIHKVASRLDVCFRHACELVSEQTLVKAFSSSDAVNSLGNVFGGLSETHGLSAKPIEWGFTPTEPQITGALAYFMSYEFHGAKGNQRALAFLRALLKNIDNKPLKDSLEIPQNITVMAEEPVPSSNGSTRRIDLLFEWHKPVKTTVLVEAKFGHKVTTGQLPNYRQYALKNSEQYELFLLTLNGKKSTQNKYWNSISWHQLLKKWEQELTLTDCNDDDFHRFKANLWQKTTGA
ncbi:MAG: PD-(D/E)XK nuclease family protein [Alphaproteobacteria bacterium]|nr:PD-(D/E)XK nuclease family protein [Alphaproteobacteria bacterium]